MPDNPIDDLDPAAVGKMIELHDRQRNHYPILEWCRRMEEKEREATEARK